MEPIGSAKALGLWGALIQIIVGVYLTGVYLLPNPPTVRTFGLNYTLYDLLFIPPLLTGIVMILSGAIATLVLLDRIQVKIGFNLDRKINILVFLGFIGNCIGGLLVFGAGIVLSIYQQKHGKKWPDDLNK